MALIDHKDESAVVSIKKYPNRRYYDSSQSRHVTLEDIHKMIRAGRRIQVTDSKTDTDITSRVLAQIILEMDSLKLGMFPSPLLHKLIQSNELIVQEFVELYFNRALDWFLSSREVYEDHFRRAMGLGTQGPAEAPDGSLPHPMKATPPPLPLTDTNTILRPSPQAEDLHNRVEQLSKRVESLQTQLHSARADKA